MSCSSSCSKNVPTSCQQSLSNWKYNTNKGGSHEKNRILPSDNSSILDCQFATLRLNNITHSLLNNMIFDMYFKMAAERQADVRHSGDGEQHARPAVPLHAHRPRRVPHRHGQRGQGQRRPRSGKKQRQNTRANVSCI